MEPSNKVLDSIGNSAEATRVVDEFKLKVKTIEDISQEACDYLFRVFLAGISTGILLVEEGISLENKTEEESTQES